MSGAAASWGPAYEATWANPPPAPTPGMKAGRWGAPDAQPRGPGGTLAEKAAPAANRWEGGAAPPATAQPALGARGPPGAQPPARLALEATRLCRKKWPRRWVSPRRGAQALWGAACRGPRSWGHSPRRCGPRGRPPSPQEPASIRAPGRDAPSLSPTQTHTHTHVRVHSTAVSAHLGFPRGGSVLTCGGSWKSPWTLVWALV